MRVVARGPVPRWGVLGGGGGLGGDVQARAEEVGRAMAKREAPISFSNPRAREFFVDGTTIPDGECKLRLGRGIERVLMVIAQ